MTELNRQQLCAALGISESTVRRLEAEGLPFTPVGVRSKRYDLAECKAWLRANAGRPVKVTGDASDAALQRAANEFTASCRNVQLRVIPSK